MKNSQAVLLGPAQDRSHLCPNTLLSRPPAPWQAPMSDVSAQVQAAQLSPCPLTLTAVHCRDRSISSLVVGTVPDREVRRLHRLSAQGARAHVQCGTTQGPRAYGGPLHS